MESSADNNSGSVKRLMSRRIVVKDLDSEATDLMVFPLSIVTLELMEETPLSKGGIPEYRSGISFPIWASTCSISPFKDEIPGVVYCDFPVLIEKHSTNRYCVRAL